MVPSEAGTPQSMQKHKMSFEAQDCSAVMYGDIGFKSRFVGSIPANRRSVTRSAYSVTVTTRHSDLTESTGAA